MAKEALYDLINRAEYWARIRDDRKPVDTNTGELGAPDDSVMSNKLEVGLADALGKGVQQLADQCSASKTQFLDRTSKCDEAPVRLVDIYNN